MKPPSATLAPHPLPRSRRGAQAGLGLIELMVALVLGMIAVLVVLQVFQSSEGSKRSIVGSTDAHNNGALALTALQRELRQAGYGAGGFTTAGCDVTLPGGRTLVALAPVTINHPNIPAGDSNTDTLLVVYGSSGGAPEGNRVTGQTATNVYDVITPTAFAVGDLVLASPAARATPCTLQLEAVTVVTSPSPPAVTVGTGTAGMANGRLFNFGATPRVLAYAVRSGNLTECDDLVNDCTAAGSVGNPAIWVPISDNIVSLRAQYGRDNSGPPADGVVDVYDQTAPASACDWTRVAALRVVVVARSQQLEKTDVTTAAPTWAGSASSAIGLSSLSDWKRYRYRSFETTVPLRNVAWQGAQAGC